jgi:TonB family protein
LVHSVQIIESTHSQILDTAAMQTLRTWKAAPGTDWTAEVPLTFSP